MPSTTTGTDFYDWYARRTGAMREALRDMHAELERLTYLAGALDSAARADDTAKASKQALEMIGRLQKLDGMAIDAIAADSHAEHELTETADRLAPPFAPWRTGRERPVGLEEIARELKVKRPTVDQWRQRGVLPEPWWTVSGSPVWPWHVIEAWARQTGRLG